MSFQKTVVGDVAAVAVFFETAVAVVLKLTTVVAVIAYNLNLTKNWKKVKKIICIKEIQV